ncbi:ABC transporter ATP-binding protein [Archaeoglobus veneficus]|uniref:Iron-chelate-transporting ATPase n=1 Tax=Archaeoglobus veneficus (strain DSM 11195 / SNP6) TaxID=693661 RepID=F2KQ48_ARCVS|nr:ABC transporter ATP-binding protein [Archaeoglobus veneficus]AEA47651.1 Iron-chelate-transporting ATPase [Archaeoglobus veneficus SNP6]
MKIERVKTARGSVGNVCSTNNSSMNAAGLSVGYTNEILKNVSFEVRAGEILGILGPNGSGKSTLLKTLAAGLKPLGGAVYVDGREVHGIKPGELAKLISITLTERVDAGFLTGFEVVSLGRYPYVDAIGRLNDADVEAVMGSLRLVNAENLANKLFSEMSDGERQKIMIARALAQQPRIMLLDEPTSFLDAKHKVEIMLLLRRIANEKGIAIVLTTHDIELALRICDRVVMVRDGRIAVEGLPEEVITGEVVGDIYDVGSARFDPSIGSFELTCKNGSTKTRVHVVCGGGSGANIMRLLAKKGIPFTAGVVHEGDVDCCVAKLTALNTVCERPYTEIGDKAFEKALKLAESCDLVIDTGFVIGSINRRNLELLNSASNVLSLRSKDELGELGIDAKPVGSITQLLKELGL